MKRSLKGKDEKHPFIHQVSAFLNTKTQRHEDTKMAQSVTWFTFNSPTWFTLCWWFF